MNIFHKMQKATEEFSSVAFMSICTFGMCLSEVVVHDALWVYAE